MTEDELEHLDEKIAKLVLRQAEAEDQGETEISVRKDFPGRPEAEVHEICRLQLVKRWRQRYRIPYLSLFYY